MSTRTKQRNADLRAKAAPRLSRRYIIFMNGAPLTGKTTIAKYLAEQLGIRLLPTYEHGSVVKNGVLDRQKRLDRYRQLKPRAHALLVEGQSVILDGSFVDYKRRSWVYAFAREFDTGLIAVRTACDDPAMIPEREQQRVADRGNDGDVVARFYHGILAEVRANPLENDAEFWELGGEVIEFHTGRMNFVSCAPHASHDARLISLLLAQSGLIGPA